MKPSDSHEVIHAFAAEMAEKLYADWRRLERKDPEDCIIGVALDGSEPHSVRVLTVRIPWAALETATVDSLTRIFCASVRACAIPSEDQLEQQMGRTLH